MITCAMGAPKFLVKLHDPIVNCFAVRYTYLVSLSFKLSNFVSVFRATFSVYYCMCSILCVFISFLPFKAKAVEHRRKSHMH